MAEKKFTPAKVELDKFADRTRTTVERGPRDPDDRRTHTERINGLGPGRFGEAEETPEPVFTDGAEERKPYRTTERSTWQGALIPPGSLVHLLPHEVGGHHRPHEVPDEPDEPT